MQYLCYFSECELFYEWYAVNVNNVNAIKSEGKGGSAPCFLRVAFPQEWTAPDNFIFVLAKCPCRTLVVVKLSLRFTTYDKVGLQIGLQRSGPRLP